MLKRTVLVSCLVAFIMIGPAAAGLAASWHGGGGYGATPSYVVPASADLYIELNGGSGQGQALRRLWMRYRSHPGTAAALARLTSGLHVGRNMLPMNTMPAAIGNRVGIGLWMPAGAGGIARARVALVAPLGAAGLTGAAGSLGRMGALTVVTTYRGVTVYRVSSQTGGTGYVCVVMGDGVLASDLATVEQAIDAATFHAPSLATSPSFVNTTSTLPAVRAVLLYVTPRFVRYAQRSSGSAGVGTLPPSTLRLLTQPYAVAVSAAADGLSIVTSAVPTSGLNVGPTPNQGAGVVGNNALLYLSLNNLAAILVASRALPAGTLRRLRMQTGIAIGRDLLPLLSHEVVIDVNDETSALLLVASQATQGSAQAVPTLPGSIELATWVDSPVAAQQAMRRVAAALLRLIGRQGNGGQPVTVSTLPDGSTAYNITALPTISYTFRGHWLILSTNLSADVTAARVPLAADPGYQAALAHVSGPGTLASVAYINVTRLLKVVNAWITYAAAHPSSSSGSSGAPGSGASTLASWRQIEPLLAPIGSIIDVTRRVGASSQQVAMFIGISP